MEKLAEGLVARGHTVSIVVGEECSYAFDSSMAKIFKLSEEFLQDHKKHEKMFITEELSQMPSWAAFIFLNMKQLEYYDLLLSDKKTMDDLKEFDMVIGDSLYPCSYLLADVLNKQHVIIHMFRHIGILHGITNYPSYVPQYSSLAPTNMRFMDRVYNLITYLQNLYVKEMYIIPGLEEIKNKHNIKPEKSIKETLKTVELILLEKDFTLQYSQPVPPFIKETGSFMAGPSKPLPPDLEDFILSSGDHGVILVSFGSMIDSLDSSVLQVMNKAFSRLPQKVLWRLNLVSSTPSKQNGDDDSSVWTMCDRSPIKLAKNIKAVKWLPQNDILGHNQTRLFITHAGANGIAEGLYHGVPMLCSPFFGDQFDNSAFIANTGRGLVSRVSTTTCEKLTFDIQTILNDNRYLQRSNQASKAATLRRTGVEEAVGLVEYVLAVGDLSHLKPRGLSMPFYQLYMLDVMCIIVGIMVLLMTLIRYAGMWLKNHVITHKDKRA